MNRLRSRHKRQKKPQFVSLRASMTSASVLWSVLRHQAQFCRLPQLHSQYADDLVDSFPTGGWLLGCLVALDLLRWEAQLGGQSVLALSGGSAGLDRRSGELFDGDQCGELPLAGAQHLVLFDVSL